MKSHPLIMTERSINAFLAGRKWQTRHVQTKHNTFPDGTCLIQPGDELWFKESFALQEISGYSEVLYRADYEAPAPEIAWKSPRFMPRRAARCVTICTAVRGERLQDITFGDCRAEGMSDSYVRMWDEINAKRGYRWDTNPLVWVIEWKPESA